MRRQLAFLWQVGAFLAFGPITALVLVLFALTFIAKNRDWKIYVLPGFFLFFANAIYNWTVGLIVFRKTPPLAKPDGDDWPARAFFTSERIEQEVNGGADNWLARFMGHVLNVFDPDHIRFPK